MFLEQWKGGCKSFLYAISSYHPPLPSHILLWGNLTPTPYFRHALPCKDGFVQYPTVYVVGRVGWKEPKRDNGYQNHLPAGTWRQVLRGCGTAI